MKDIRIKRIKPMYTRVLLTCDRYPEESLVFTGTKIIDGSKATKRGGNIKEVQKVIAVGSSVREVKEGDIVFVEMGNFAVRKYVEGEMRDKIQSMTNDTIEYRIPVVEMDGETYMYVDERDISYVVTDYEEEE